MATNSTRRLNKYHIVLDILCSNITPLDKTNINARYKISADVAIPRQFIVNCLAFGFVKLGEYYTTMGAVFSDESPSGSRDLIVLKSVPEKPKPPYVVVKREVFERLNHRSQALHEIERLSKNGPRASNELQPIEGKYDLSKRANVLVFHHYEYEDKRDNRDGSMRDMEKIEEVLKYYRTDPLQIHSNCSLPALRQVMENVSKTDFSKNSCLIVFIMSHGGIQDTILAHDGGWYSLHTDIVEKCTLNNTLKGKPKIFVIQACRGNAHMQTDSTKKVISDKSDIVIFQSTYEGSVSWRTMGGTFFMQEFLNLLQSIESSIDVNELNISLNARFRKESINQTPTLTTKLQNHRFSDFATTGSGTLDLIPQVRIL